jgi:hypothetical protein
MPTSLRRILLALLLIAGLILAPEPSPGATVETHAQVQLVEPTAASVTLADDDAATWSLDGTPEDRLQVTVEVRDADGNLLEQLAGDEVTLDAAGQAAATLPLADDPGPHDPLPVTTLVICRE